MKAEEIEKIFREKLEELNSTPENIKWEKNTTWIKLNKNLKPGFNLSFNKILFGGSAFTAIVFSILFFTQTKEKPVQNKSSEHRIEKQNQVKLKQLQTQPHNEEISKVPLTGIANTKERKIDKESSIIISKKENPPVEKKIDESKKIISLGDSIQATEPKKDSIDSPKVKNEKAPISIARAVPKSKKNNPNFDWDRFLDQDPPPGTILLEGTNIFVDQVEIANVHWLEFLLGIKDSSKAYQTSMLPDTSIGKRWIDYINNKAYYYFPIVGISYEQALEYCKWRSDIVNIVHKPKYKISYRLPTKEEWITIASINLREGFNKTLNCGPKEDTLRNPAWTNNFKVRKPKRNEIVNLLGNVAEMTDEKGIAKGGSWHHPYRECKVESLNYYQKPEPWLGFRCIAEYEFK